ncbi:MAG TPA: DUF2760 domain-containing protein [Nannocystaceae bacterium]|nr:DUF2760 domain-containing protein [Nannocystaceae bacterium]
MEPLGFGARLWLAFVLPWRVLFDGVLAARVQQAGDGVPSLPPAPEPKVAVREAEVVDAGPDFTPALQLLAILQREGRLVDFLEEDVSSFSDADIGAAARVVHEGCKRALAQHIELARVRSEEEGSAIELPRGFDAARVRVTGNVVGEPPYRGSLAHAGWQVKSIKLPKTTAGHDPKIVAPAEVELGA